MSMIIKNVNSNFIHKIDMQPENICLTEEFMYNPFVFFYCISQSSKKHYAWENLFVTNQIFAVVIFLSFVTMKKKSTFRISMFDQFNHFSNEGQCF